MPASLLVRTVSRRSGLSEIAWNELVLFSYTNTEGSSELPGLLVVTVNVLPSEATTHEDWKMGACACKVVVRTARGGGATRGHVRSVTEGVLSDAAARQSAVFATKARRVRARQASNSDGVQQVRIYTALSS